MYKKFEGAAKKKLEKRSTSINPAGKRQENE